MLMQNFIKLIVQRLFSYSVNRESDDAENNTDVATAGRNNTNYTNKHNNLICKS